MGNEAVPPFWAATLRLALAAVLLGAIARATGARFPRGAALRGALLFGFFNFGVNLGLLYWGELRVPSGVAAVFYATNPLSTGLLAALFGVERLDARKTVAALAAMAGVAIVFAGELSLEVPAIALLAVFAAATAAALSNIFLKRAPRQAAIPVNAVGACVGALVCLAASVLAGEDRALPTTTAGWGPILYLTIAGSLGAYVIYTWLVARWDITKTSLVGVTAPVVAVLVGAVVKGERPATITLLGAALVLGAVIAGLRTPRRAKAEPAPG